MDQVQNKDHSSCKSSCLQSRVDTWVILYCGKNRWWVHSLYKFYGALCMQILLPPRPENPSYAPRTLAIKSAFFLRLFRGSSGCSVECWSCRHSGKFAASCNFKEITSTGAKGIIFHRAISPRGQWERGTWREGRRGGLHICKQPNWLATYVHINVQTINELPVTKLHQRLGNGVY